jgi:hypothetical protein
MGRIVDLCVAVAAAGDDGPEGLVLPPQTRVQFLQEWEDEDIDDALILANGFNRQSDLVEATDSLSARLLAVLGAYGEEKAFAEAVKGEARIDVDVIRQLARRLDRLEEILDVFRDEDAPDRQGFDALQRRLIDQGIEDEMRPDWERQEAGDDDTGEESEG